MLINIGPINNCHLSIKSNSSVLPVEDKIWETNRRRGLETELPTQNIDGLYAKKYRFYSIHKEKVIEIYRLPCNASDSLQ